MIVVVRGMLTSNTQHYDFRIKGIITYSKIKLRALLLKFRCSDPSEFNSYASAICCNSCDGGWVIPVEPLDLKVSWQCDKCKGYLSIDQVIQMDNNLVSELQRVNKKSVENMEKFHKVYEKFLHPSHVFLMQLKQWLFEGKYFPK